MLEMPKKSEQQAFCRFEMIETSGKCNCYRNIRTV